MTQKELKRVTGYIDVDYHAFCGNCVSIKRKGGHLRCGRYGFAVKEMGICRRWNGTPAPMTNDKHPLFVAESTTDHHESEAGHAEQGM